jgi:hypothetical protein
LGRIGAGNDADPLIGGNANTEDDDDDADVVVLNDDVVVDSNGGAPVDGAATSAGVLFGYCWDWFGDERQRIISIIIARHRRA